MNRCWFCGEVSDTYTTMQITHSEWVTFPICDPCLFKEQRKNFFANIKAKHDLDIMLKEYAKSIPMLPLDSSFPYIEKASPVKS